MIFLDTPILSVTYRRKYSKDVEKPIEVMMLPQMVAEHKPIQIPGIVVQDSEPKYLRNSHEITSRFYF
jgi:hypothetical protein